MDKRSGTAQLSWAFISDDGLYRYSLTRHVAPLTGEGTATFVMLNPSTADAETDDPTIRRCIGFARSWGFEWLKVVNLFAFRATDPRELLAADDPSGPENLCTIAKVVGGSDLVVCAWGAFPLAGREHVDLVLELIAAPHALGLTKNGSPRHPLYVRGDARPEPFAHCHPVAAWSVAA
jgi:hypothetical protein